MAMDYTVSLFNATSPASVAWQNSDILIGLVALGVMGIWMLVFIQFYLWQLGGK